MMFWKVDPQTTGYARFRQKAVELTQFSGAGWYPATVQFFSKKNPNDPASPYDCPLLGEGGIFFPPDVTEPLRGDVERILSAARSAWPDGPIENPLQATEQNGFGSGPGPGPGPSPNFGPGPCDCRLRVSPADLALVAAHVDPTSREAIAAMAKIIAASIK